MTPEQHGDRTINTDNNSTFHVVKKYIQNTWQTKYPSVTYITDNTYTYSLLSVTQNMGDQSGMKNETKASLHFILKNIMPLKQYIQLQY